MPGAEELPLTSRRDGGGTGGRPRSRSKAGSRRRGRSGPHAERGLSPAGHHMRVALSESLRFWSLRRAAVRRTRWSRRPTGERPEGDRPSHASADAIAPKRSERWALGVRATDPRAPLREPSCGQSGTRSRAFCPRHTPRKGAFFVADFRASPLHARSCRSLSFRRQSGPSHNHPSRRLSTNRGPLAQIRPRSPRHRATPSAARQRTEPSTRNPRAGLSLKTWHQTH